jgi:WD40 repeat protein
MAVAACFESGNEDRIVFSDGLGICVWSWKELKQPLVLIPLDRLPRLIVAEDIVSPKSTRMIYLLGIDGVLYQLDMDAKKCVQQKRVRDSRGSRGHGSLCSTIEGSKLLYNTDSAINVIDLKAKADHEVVTMKGKDFITSMAVSKEIPLIVTGCGSGKVWLWDTRTGEHKVFCEDSGGGHSVAISAGEDLLAIEADKGAIVVYSIKQKRILCSMKGLDTGYTRIGFLNNDKGIYASGESSEIQFLDLTLDKKE